MFMRSAFLCDYKEINLEKFRVCIFPLFFSGIVIFMTGIRGHSLIMDSSNKRIFLFEKSRDGGSKNQGHIQGA